MKAVLISIRPKWCELIASGEKTVEVRKRRPKLKPPFKVYIYCTQASPYNPVIPMRYEKEGGNIYTGGKRYAEFLTSKVIGEFVCDNIESFSVPYPAYFASVGDRETRLLVDAKLTKAQAHRYLQAKTGYGWHISNLKIYDEPKELGEFYAEGDCDCMNCKNCAWFDRGNGYNVEDDCNLAYKGAADHKAYKPITRPPQSWCYVEGK